MVDRGFMAAADAYVCTVCWCASTAGINSSKGAMQHFSLFTMRFSGGRTRSPGRAESAKKGAVLEQESLPFLDVLLPHRVDRKHEVLESERPGRLQSCNSRNGQKHTGKSHVETHECTNSVATRAPPVRR